MATNKNQHFVPRCYLKPFTLNGEGLAINVYNLDRRRGIRNAPVKSQCSSDYFYGEDLRIEKLLQKSEARYANTLRNLSEPFHKLSEMDKSVLRHFCHLQHSRTEAAAQKYAVLASEMTDFAFQGQSPPEMQVSIREAVLAGLQAFADSIHAISDLKVCLVRNRTTRPFVTSDDPAVLTNRWYDQNAAAKGQSSGIGSAGAIFLFPLSPRILCLIYDGDVYSIPNEVGWTDLNRITDVDAFNEQQFLNCTANVYFGDWGTLTQVDRAFESIVGRRLPASHEVVFAVLDSENSWGQRFRVVQERPTGEGQFLIHTKSVRPQPSRWPSILKWRSNKKVYSNGSGTGFIRRARAEQSSYGSVPYKRVK